jgi:hypothetical protein
MLTLCPSQRGSERKSSYQPIDVTFLCSTQTLDNGAANFFVFPKFGFQLHSSEYVLESKASSSLTLNQNLIISRNIFGFLYWSEIHEADTVFWKKEVNQINIPIAKTCYHRENGRGCSCLIKEGPKHLQQWMIWFKFMMKSLYTTE